MKEKPHCNLYGRLVFPPAVGRPAVIQEEQGVRITSEVLHFLAADSDTVFLETRNTKYVLDQSDGICHSPHPEERHWMADSTTGGTAAYDGIPGESR